MTPEEIRKQMMGSAGMREEAAFGLDSQRSAPPKITIFTEADANGREALPDVISACVRADAPEGELKYILLANDAYLGNAAADDQYTEFMQAAAMPEGAVPPEGFDLQYREGKDGDHFSVPRLLTREELEQTLLKYLAGDRSFKDDFEWHHLASRESQAADPAGSVALDIKPIANQSKLTCPPRQPGAKSMILALVLALLFGPIGVFYVSWKRALFMLLLFIVGVFLIPKNEFVVLLLWLVVPILSIIALGVGRRQDEPTPDEAFWSGNPPAA